MGGKGTRVRVKVDGMGGGGGGGAGKRASNAGEGVETCMKALVVSSMDSRK